MVNISRVNTGISFKNVTGTFLLFVSPTSHALSYGIKTNIIYQVLTKGGSLGHNITVLQQRACGDRGAAISWQWSPIYVDNAPLAFPGRPPLGNILLGPWGRAISLTMTVSQRGKTFSPLPEIKQHKNTGCRTSFFYSPSVCKEK